MVLGIGLLRRNSIVLKAFYFVAVEREGQPNMDDDWDSLSVRMRRQRRLRLAGKTQN